MSKHISLLPIVVSLLLLCSCSPKVVTTTELIYVRDTVSVTTTTRDTVFVVTVPVESVSNITADTTSRLETSVAVSEATVSAGVLTHTLDNKPVELKTNTVYITDTLRVESEIQYYPKYIEVEVVPQSYKTAVIVLSLSTAVLLLVLLVIILRRLFH